MFKYLLKISRPRFWLYLAGPFIIGYILGINSMSDVLSLGFILGILFFLIPANIFLYGINDYFDYDTDRLNPKKQSKEQLVTSKLRSVLLFWLIGCLVLFFAYALTVRAGSKLILLIFFLLSAFYSAPPLRFKSTPVIDSISNVLYFLPGLLAYHELTGLFPHWSLILAFACWTTAMHLYSAIPDIKFDRKAGLKTTAVVLGKKMSLWVCFFLWLIFFVSVILNVLMNNFGGVYSFIFWILLIYPLMMLYILFSKVDIAKAYWYYPYITGILGFIISIVLIILKYHTTG